MSETDSSLIGSIKYYETEAYTFLSTLLNQFIIRKKLKNWIKSKENSPVRRRNECIREIVQSEEGYVQSLRLLLDSYIEPVKQNTQLLSEKKAKLLFSNIEQILQVNEYLLVKLKEATSDWPSKNQFGQVFKLLAPFFKIYVTYICNYENALFVLDRCEQKKNTFFQYMEDQQIQYPSKYGLRTLLIMPNSRFVINLIELFVTVE